MSQILAWIGAALGATALSAAAVVAVGDRPSTGSPSAAAETAVPPEDELPGDVANVPVFTGNLLVVGGAAIHEAVSSAFASAGLDGRVLTVGASSSLPEAANAGANAVLIDATLPDIDWNAVAGFVDEGRMVYAVNTDLAHLARRVWSVLEAKGVTADDLGVPLSPEDGAIAVPGASAYIVTSDRCLRTGTREPAAGLDFARIISSLGAAQHCAGPQFDAEVEQ